MISTTLQFNDTIIAIATPQGVGAIGVIRLSGTDAIKIVDKLFDKKNILKQSTHTTHVGFLKDNNEIIDEVVISIFKTPTSYTGEDVIEIGCHGSAFILQKILQTCISKGARLANAGEFTQRAFLNGKLDLLQAEAVADLISSENKASHEIALNQMRGGVSNELKKVREELINFTSLIELELDFGEEDVEFANREQLLTLVLKIKIQLLSLVQSFSYGNALKNGVPVAIIGKPNAGKSSLLNKILKEDRAIVSSIAGTTRDTIEEVINIDGIAFRLIDTAGLRDTVDEIETIGISKALEKIEQAKIILYLFDKNETNCAEIIADLQKIDEDKIVILCPSKDDLYVGFDWRKWLNELDTFNNLYSYLINISVVDETHLGISCLLETMVKSIRGNINENSVIISNARHVEYLSKAIVALKDVEAGLTNNLSGDLISFHLKDTIRAIGNITGVIDIDKDILGTIFGKFCIGK